MIFSVVGPAATAHVGIFHLRDRGRPDAVGLEGQVLDDLWAHVSAGLDLPPFELDVRPDAPPVQVLDGANIVGERRLRLLWFSERLKSIKRTRPTDPAGRTSVSKCYHLSK